MAKCMPRGFAVKQGNGGVRAFPHRGRDAVRHRWASTNPHMPHTLLRPTVLQGEASKRAQPHSSGSGGAMQVYTSAVLAIVAFSLGAMPAWAQSAPPVAVTAFVAMGTDGASPVGAAIAFPISSALSIEADAAYRRGEGRIHAPSTNANLLFSVARFGRVTPYAAAGAGLTRYGTVVTFTPAATGIPQLGTDSRLTATVNFGGGIKAHITDRFDFRTDVRWFQSPASQANADQFRIAFGVGFNLEKR